MIYTMTLKAVEQFTDELLRQERTKATVEKYAFALRSFYHWLPDKKYIDKETVIRYKEHLCSRYAPASVNTMLSAMCGFFRYMGWSDCCVRHLRIQKRLFCARERELSKEEYKRLVAAAVQRKDRRSALLLQVIASTGIRVSEIAYITVEAARRGKAEITLKGKIRTILLPAQLCKKLLHFAGKRKIRSGPIMRSKRDTPMDRREIWRCMKSLCRQANVEPQKVFPHNLRHLFARIFYQTQQDVVKLADLLGHSSIETTRIYLLASGEEHRRELEQLGLVL